ncbi:MAG: heparinase, partial [Maribacter sp.]
YQHLWSEGCGSTTEENTKISWLDKGKFYTLTSTISKDDELRFVRIGANDAEFNLRREPGFIIRRKETQNTIFVSITESHGSYSPVTESAINSNSNIKELKVILDNVDYTAISITTVNDITKVFIIANNNASKEETHTLNINDKNYEWSGSYYFK